VIKHVRGRRPVTATGRYGGPAGIADLAKPRCLSLRAGRDDALGDERQCEEPSVEGEMVFDGIEYGAVGGVEPGQHLEFAALTAVTGRGDLEQAHDFVSDGAPHTH
jgi:hypothetical protein